MEYRAISKTTGEWVYGQYVYIPDFKTGRGKSAHWIVQNFFQNGGWLSTGTTHPVEPETICVKSLISDKNKKDIYSGDIIRSCTAIDFKSNEKLENIILKVYWSLMDGFFLYTIDGRKMSFNDIYNFEVIGNAFEEETERINGI